MTTPGQRIAGFNHREICRITATLLLPCAAAAAVPLEGNISSQLPVYGDYYAHDPSRMIKEGNTYYVHRTRQGIMGKTSTDLRNWTYGGVFPGNPPACRTDAVPGFTGFFGRRTSCS